MTWQLSFEADPIGEKADLTAWKRGIAMAAQEALLTKRLRQFDGPLAISAELSQAKAREIAQALIDAADRAEGKVPYCRCAAGERTNYEVCRECSDEGDKYEADGLGGE